MAVGILGPWPGWDRGGTLGGMACQPPPTLLVSLGPGGVGDTWGGRPMVIMSTASLSTPFMSTGLCCGCLLASPDMYLGCGGWTLNWPGLGIMLGGGVLYCIWPGLTRGLATPAS